jgi:hypothetical protein
MTVFNKNHRMHATDFRVMRNRADHLPLSAIDEKIQSLVLAINKSPELVTLWSCQGHDDNSGWDEPYIMIGVRDPDHIDELSRLFRHHLGEQQHLMGITQTSRINFLKQPHPKTGKHFWFPVWNLHWKVTPEFNREAGWAVAAKVAEDFVRYLEMVKGHVS